MAEKTKMETRLNDEIREVSERTLALEKEIVALRVKEGEWEREKGKMKEKEEEIVGRKLEEINKEKEGLQKKVESLEKKQKELLEEKEEVCITNQTKPNHTKQKAKNKFYSLNFVERTTCYVIPTQRH